MGARELKHEAQLKDWREKVTECRSSGTSVKKWCEERRIDRKTYYVEQYQRYADMEALPDEAIADLLDRVTVWPDGRLEVSLKFLNELSVLVVS